MATDVERDAVPASDRIISEILVEGRSLTKVFGRNGSNLIAVDDLSFFIRRNEVVGLVGESGSGKSTLGKMIVGLEAPSEGDVLYQDKSLNTKKGKRDFKKSARLMQMIFQDPYGSLNPRMTIEEIVSEGLRLSHRQLTPSEIRSRVVESLELVGLNVECLSRYPHEFSGGQRQRVGIARALVLKPEFIVCDEPISALDVSVQAQVINLLCDLKDQLGLTLLFIAHDLSMVRYISDRVLVMYRGHLVESGLTEEIFNSPQHPYTQALLSANPITDPKLARERNTPALQGEITEVIAKNVAGNAAGHIDSNVAQSNAVGEGCIFAARCPLVEDSCHSYKGSLSNPTNPLASKSENQNPHLVACIKYRQSSF